MSEEIKDQKITIRVSPTEKKGFTDRKERDRSQSGTSKNVNVEVSCSSNGK